MKMKKAVLKCIASVVIVSVIFGLSGCFRTKKPVPRDGETVSADDPWFDCESVQCAEEYNDYDIYKGSEFRSRFIGKVAEGYVYKAAFMQGDMGTDSFCELALYSDTGEKLAAMDLIDAFAEAYPGLNWMDYSDYYSYYVEDGQVKYLYQNNNELDVFVINVAAGDITLETTYQVPGGWDLNHCYFTKCGGYMLFTVYGTPLQLISISPSGDVTVFTADNSVNRDYPSFVLPPIPVSDHDLLTANVGVRDGLMWCYDIEANTLRTAERDEFAWIYDYVQKCVTEQNYSYTASDGTVYFFSDDSISRADIVSQSLETIAVYEQIDINRAVFSSQALCYIIEARDGYLEFAVTDDKGLGFELYKATRAEQNPNAGKTIITTDGHTEYVYDAVYLFNRTDDDYFVKIVPYKYTGSGNTSSDEELPWIYQGSEIQNQMRIDLMSGDCPDVVFYVSSYNMLNSGTCMYDMSEFYEASDIRDHLFGNIIEASRVDGGLYSIPLRFGIQGILMGKSEHTGDGAGMSFDEFYTFTHDNCNGLNILSQTQSRFMNLCVNYSYDLFTRDGSIDFDNEAFRQIAEYTYNNVSDVEDQEYFNRLFTDGGTYSESLNGMFGWLDHFGRLTTTYEDATVIGYPSPDMRGSQAAQCYLDTVSITKECSDPEGAWRFVCMLLNVDLQRYLCSPLTDWSAMTPSDHGFPINRDAYNLVAEDAVYCYNAYAATQNQFSWAPSIDENVTVSDLDNLRDVIEAIDHCASGSNDSDIDVIIYEEMQAYFVGDKTLDEVIEIMNDRARTVINERG
ncbi:MAG: hypothetical protein J5685_01700 [Clostridiales bacterium]|nr:hypothetical protein [Clostridiales bacterium]